ncbi:MAG: phosphate ABC transporter substrate-binding protein PstS [Solirubrobacterales bacterium]
MTKRLLSVALAASLTIGIAACGSSSSSSTSSTGSSGSPLVGAGSTLVAPLMSKWQSGYSSKTGETVTYGAIGSGGGIAQITSRTVDFGASDAPLTTDQFKEANGVEQIPWALSGTVPAYNVKGAPKNLKLSGAVLADIYLGKITSWNDPAIAKLNPGTSLPSTKITPIYRSDGSGDTYAFTNYLSTVDPEFKSKVGTSTSVKFPVGTGAEGNDGVSAAISQTDGAIGYVGLAYALSNKLNMPLVENSAGNFPVPGVKSVEAAASAVKTINKDNSISLADLPSSAKGAYPISTYTYVIVPLSSSKASALQKFITYAIGPGQEYGPPLDFAPLPSQVIAADKKAIAKIGS